MNPALKSKLGNYWVFREGRKRVNGPAFLREVLDSVSQITGRPASDDTILGALVIAGELESALADVGSSSLAAAEAITDYLADRLVGREATSEEVLVLRLAISQITVPEHLSVSPPEGFAYYALHPSDFANLAKQATGSGGPVTVIGIRSIGTTLSAVVAAANRLIGRAAERITVRPVGHPYDRVTEFTPEQTAWIKARVSPIAEFQVVDEGPGRSGSSFLSVAEALINAGVDRRSITLLGSRAVQPSDLCANDAVGRWSQFRFFSPITQVYERFKDDFYVGAGDWRKFIALSPGEWPACWPQMERLKFLSADRRRLYKFEGFGQFGEEILARARCSAEAGFGPAVERVGDGMLSYSVVPGQHLNARMVDRNLLDRVAEYCAFRERSFRCQQLGDSQLDKMVDFNLGAEYGDLMNLVPASLYTNHPILVDGRMQPHEWILRNDGALLKLDGTSHGDDHFFPGPADIAWDLAGTIVEWDLDQNATEFFMDSYFRASGDNAQHRIQAFVRAYTMFRVAYCGMALTTVIGTPEEPRLEAAYQRYRRVLAERFKPTVPPTCSFSEKPNRRIQLPQSAGND